MTENSIVDIVMPQMGVAITEGTVSKWYVAEGASVQVDEVVCEISTDKTDTEVFAPCAGILFEIVIHEGASVYVGKPLARLAVGEVAAHVKFADGAGSSSEAVAASTAVAARGIDVEPTLPDRVPGDELRDVGITAARPRERVSDLLAGANIDPARASSAVLGRLSASSTPLSSALARRRARERGIDISTIVGSGPNGRIGVHDVLAASKGAEVTTPQPPSLASPGLPPGYETTAHDVVPTSPHRRATAQQLHQSTQTAAHMYTEVEVDMQHVTSLRSEINHSRNEKGQPRATYLSFIAKAAVAMLEEFSDLNTTFQGNHSIFWKTVNLGIAVDTPTGLVVPVIRDAQELSVADLADEIVSLAERARNRRLRSDELQAGTFTISNPGSVGAVAGPGIINQPQVAIMGVPVIVKRPWVVEGPDGLDAIAIRPIMKLALTYDHRAIDGAYATRYLVRVKELLTTWTVQDFLRGT